MNGWLAAVGAVLAGVIAFLVRALKAKELERQLTEQAGFLKLKDGRIKELEEALRKEMGDHATDVGLLKAQLERRDAVIEQIKGEAAALEMELEGCAARDPEAMRHRLNALLKAGKESS